MRERSLFVESPFAELAGVCGDEGGVAGVSGVIAGDAAALCSMAVDSAPGLLGSTLKSFVMGG